MQSYPLSFGILFCPRILPVGKYIKIIKRRCRVKNFGIFLQNPTWLTLLIAKEAGESK